VIEVLVHISKINSLEHQLIILFICIYFYKEFSIASKDLLYHITENYITNILNKNTDSLVLNTIEKINEKLEKIDLKVVVELIQSLLGNDSTFELVCTFPYVLNCSIEIFSPSFVENNSVEPIICLDSNDPQFQVEYIKGKLGFRNSKLCFGILQPNLIFFYGNEFKELFYYEQKIKSLFQMVI